MYILPRSFHPYTVLWNTSYMAGGWSGYGYIALVELDPCFERVPKMISPRVKGVKRVLKKEFAYMGDMLYSEGVHLLRAYLEEAEKLNCA